MAVGAGLAFLLFAVNFRVLPLTQETVITVVILVNSTIVSLFFTRRLWIRIGYFILTAFITFFALLIVSFLILVLVVMPRWPNF